jgi:hypothetical protein
MFPCPHCGKPIEVGPPANVPWWQYTPGGNASLGCGTLILIAIIVAMFSRGGADEIRDLRKDIQSLEKKIDQLEAKPVVADQPDESREVRPLRQKPKTLKAELENKRATPIVVAPAVAQEDVPPLKTPKAPLPPADKNNLPKLKQRLTM